MSTARVFNKNQCDENQWSNATVKIVGSLHEKEMRGGALRLLHAGARRATESFSVLGPNLASESEKYHHLYPFASWASVMAAWHI